MRNFYIKINKIIAMKHMVLVGILECVLMGVGVCSVTRGKLEL